MSIQRALTRSNAAAHGAHLAMSLNVLSNRLAESGRLEDALEATTEAVALRRALAAQRPAIHWKALALALGTLSRRLAACERFDEAAEARREARSLHTSSKPHA